MREWLPTIRLLDILYYSGDSGHPSSRESNYSAWPAKTDLDSWKPSISHRQSVGALTCPGRNLYPRENGIYPIWF